MDYEIKLVRYPDLIAGISELIIYWKKKKDNSILILTCGKEKLDFKTTGDIEEKIINLIQNIHVCLYVKHEREVLDGTDYTLSIKQSIYSLKLTWHELIPEEWNGVEGLVEYLMKISNAKNLCDNTYQRNRKKMQKVIHNMPFTTESLIKLLKIGKFLPHGVSHCDIADWCSRFAQFCRDEFDAGSIDYDDSLAQAEEIADDVDAQWELFLENTYYTKNIMNFDIATVELPKEWFIDWLKKLGAA